MYLERTKFDFITYIVASDKIGLYPILEVEKWITDHDLRECCGPWFLGRTAGAINKVFLLTETEAACFLLRFKS